MQTHNGMTDYTKADLEQEALGILRTERDRQGLKARVHNVSWMIRFGHHLTLFATGECNGQKLESSITL